MILLIIIAIFAIAYLKMQMNMGIILNRFKRNNVLVFGKKGKGKDLLMQNVIAHRKRERYHSNLNYGYKFNKMTLSEITVAPNVYTNFIEGHIHKIPFEPKFWKADIYISDGGIYLPSQYDNKLSHQYPSLPIAYALSRQTYQHNVHCNTQAFSRLWIKLREQADSFFLCLGVLNLGFVFIQKVRYYERAQSAEEYIAPFKKKMMNSKEKKALKAEFDAKYGEVKDMFVYIWKWKVKYNTYEFRKILFDEAQIEEAVKKYKEELKRKKKQNSILEKLKKAS